MMPKTSYNQLQKYLRHCTVFWHKWPVHDLVLVIPAPPLIKVASNRRPYSKLGGTTLNGREEGGQYYISQTRDQERFAARKVVIHGSVSTFLQLVVAPARIQNLFTHVSDIHSYNTRSATTNKFCVMSSSLEQLKNSFSRRFGVRLWNALPANIKKSASGNLLKKQIHETLTCINIFKQENLYLTPSSILEII